MVKRPGQHPNECVALSEMKRSGLPRLQQACEQPSRRFATSSLPITMELAAIARSSLLRALPPETSPFSYEDRILALLVPSMLSDIVTFYAGKGPPLAKLLEEHQLLSPVPLKSPHTGS